MRKHLPVILAFVVSATITFGGTIVDQGSPGKFGPWPVTFAEPVFPSDGGTPTAGSVGIYPYQCANSSPNSIVWMDGGVQVIGVASSRLYTVVTNLGDDQGAGSGIVKCRSDGVTPSLTAGTAGWVGTPSNSINYTNSAGAPIRCIGGGVWVGGFECVPH